MYFQRIWFICIVNPQKQWIFYTRSYIIEWVEGMAASFGGFIMICVWFFGYVYSLVLWNPYGMSDLCKNNDFCLYLYRSWWYLFYRKKHKTENRKSYTKSWVINFNMILILLFCSQYSQPCVFQWFIWILLIGYTNTHHIFATYFWTESQINYPSRKFDFDNKKFECCPHCKHFWSMFFWPQLNSTFYQLFSLNSNHIHMMMIPTHIYI